MYRHSFPKCKVQGDLSPVKFKHLSLKGAVPNKCVNCEFFFEGMCLRGQNIIDDYLNLDYGKCSVEGQTEPVAIESTSLDKIHVPTKCKSCSNLSLIKDKNQYVCLENREKWGDFYRDLDWGDWKPDYPIVGIYGRLVTKELVSLIQTKEKTKAIVLYRSINKLDTIKEARKDVELLTAKLANE